MTTNKPPQPANPTVAAWNGKVDARSGMSPRGHLIIDPESYRAYMKAYFKELTL